MNIYVIFSIKQIDQIVDFISTRISNIYEEVKRELQNEKKLIASTGTAPIVLFY